MEQSLVVITLILALSTGNAMAQSQPQPWRIDKDGAGYRVLYPDGEFTRVMPCGNSLCIQSTDPNLPTPPILPIDPFVGSRTDTDELP